ncbi:MAG: DinB family protein, partial [Candidatus Thorarchaeota archaeon]|nr:DinB family protein [Candidatus Thorarchaeota archaeon]
ITPNQVNKQIAPEVNPISWILGHCFAHFHVVLCQTCQESQLLSDDAIHYYRYGTSKEEIERTESPLTFEELVDKYLEISEMSFTYLETLDDIDFKEVLFPKIEETLGTSIQRLSLHFLGHVGQIVLIRRSLGNPGSSFMGGAHPDIRKKMLDEWTSWWSESKSRFKG